MLIENMSWKLTYRYPEHGISLSLVCCHTPSCIVLHLKPAINNVGMLDFVFHAIQVYPTDRTHVYGGAVLHDAWGKNPFHFLPGGSIHSKQDTH